MRKTIVSPKGQVVIPSDIREELQFTPGTRLGVEVREGEVRLFALGHVVDKLHGAAAPHRGEVGAFTRERRDNAKREYEKGKRWERF